MKRTNSESNRGQRPLLAGLQPLSSTIPSSSAATVSKRNRKHTADNLARPVGLRDGEVIVDNDMDGDVILDDDDDENEDEDDVESPRIATPAPFIPRPQSGFVFTPVKVPANTIFVDGLSNAPSFTRGSVRHPVPPDRTPLSTRPIFKLKTLSIKNLKPLGEFQKSSIITGTSDLQTSPDAFSRQNASVLLGAVQAITSDPPVPISIGLQMLSDACEGLVLYRPLSCESLYAEVRSELEGKALRIRTSLLHGLPLNGGIDATFKDSSSSRSIDTIQSLANLDNEGCLDWLKRLETAWQQWLDQLLLIRGILIFLDRRILIRTKHMLPIWELGLDLFRKHVLGPPLDHLSLSLSAVICKQVNLERLGKPISISSIHSISKLLHTTVGPDGFDQVILRPLIQATDSFYAEEGQRLILEVSADTLVVGGPKGYLHHSLSRIDAETERLAKLFTTSNRALNSQTESAIVQHVKTNLVLRHLENLLHKGFGRMLESFPDPDSSQSLRNLYRLLHDLGKEPSQRLRLAFLSWMKEVGSTIVGVGSETCGERVKQDEEMVEKLIGFKLKVDEVVRICFDAEREMTHVIKEAFENFINRRHNKPAELIAKYLDQKLRQGNRSMTDAEMDQCLSHVLILFRYTQGKDIFEEFYKRDLSRRLLLSKSASIDAERNMVMKLKEECGQGFTAKIESMFRDIETSTDIQAAYNTMLKKTQKKIDSGSLDLTVFVLTAGSWPTSHTPEANVVLPPDLGSHLTRFEKFYQSKHAGRRLKWSHLLGQWVVSAIFPGPGKGRKKELSVSTYQGLVLLLFNEVAVQDSIAFDTIVQRTGLSARETARTLQSLACGKVRVLAKTPKGKEVAETDSFSLNADFKHENFKIKINQIQLKETVAERNSTTHKVVIERSSLLQLSIVRIMKARKKIKHAELVLETITQLRERFQVESKEIKLAIEYLIGQDYMERVEGTKDEYRYIA